MTTPVLPDYPGVGRHVAKLPTIAETIALGGLAQTPFQFFLGSRQSSHIKEESPAQLAAAAVFASRLAAAPAFVHSQYIINLSGPVSADGDWQTELLKKNLRMSAAAGVSGVVVHVGKTAGRCDEAEGIERMRARVAACLEAATETTPLLLETPAGCGTELLCSPEAFAAFVASFDDPRLKICVDTCHVFACGFDPIDYVARLDAAWDEAVADEVKQAAPIVLVHFNDSCHPLGAKKDRHARPGSGHIGAERMQAIRELFAKRGVPMVWE